MGNRLSLVRWYAFGRKVRMQNLGINHSKSIINIVVALLFSSANVAFLMICVSLNST